MNKLMIILIILLLTSCSQKETPSSQGEIEIFFCHQINCTNTLQQYADSANTINCAFYDIEDEHLIATILSKGKIIIDEDATPLLTKRVGQGLMHNKFCIINSSSIITGSYNPTQSGVQDYNNIIIIYSETLAKHYQEIFNQLLNAKKRPSTNTQFIHNNFIIESYACPQDDCQKHLLSTLQEANHSIQLALFTFTDKKVSTLIKEKILQGVHTSGVVESWQSQKYEQYSTLQQAGAHILLETTPLLQHNKLFVIDKKIVILGSYNPTNAANTINDENIIILRNEEIASIYSQFVDQLINTTQTFK